jgi:hypothetical protein
MDPTHIILGALLVAGLAIAVVGFVALGQMLKKDEAIDAATFLALRQLEDYVKSSKQTTGKPS